MNKKILLILFFLSLIATFIVFKPYFSIFYFQNDNAKIAINIETEYKGDIYICANKNCDKAEYKNKVYSYNLNQQNPLFYTYFPIKEIEIISKDNIEDKINSASIFIGKNLDYIETFKANQIEFQNENAYSIKLDTNSNSKTIIQKAGVYFEALFYNWYFFILSYILAIIYMIKFKPDFKIKYPVLIIMLTGLFLRLSHIDFIPLWNDELYTLCFIGDSGSSFSLTRTIADAGNPPLFFIFSNFWLLFFSKTVFQIRMLALLIGLVQIYSIYFVVKKNVDKKTALHAAFLSTINIFIILQSNEIRSYILSMVFIVFGLHLFFKLKKDFTHYNLLLYILVSILLINTHYYCFLYVFSNFITGLIIFRKNLLKFCFANFISFLSFVPYFQTTVINKAFCSNFNTWIEKPDLEVFLNHITFYFGNIFFFLIVIISCFLFYKKMEKEKKEIFLYNIFSIINVFALAYLISIFSKPILFERYFCIFLPFLIINTSLILTLNYKNIIIPFIVFLFTLNIPKYENFNLFSNIDSQLRYAIKDYKRYNNLDVRFVIPDMIDYIRYYPEIPQEKVIVSNFGVREDIDLEKVYLSKLDKTKKIVLYIPEICMNSKLKYSKELNIQKINTAIMPVYKIFIN